MSAKPINSSELESGFQGQIDWALIDRAKKHAIAVSKCFIIIDLQLQYTPRGGHWQKCAPACIGSFRQCQRCG